MIVWIKRNYPLLSILFVALSLRIYQLLFWIGTPYFKTPFLDELYHQLWASSIASGNILPDGVFFRAPLYPYFLALFYWLTPDGHLFAIMTQMLLGLLSIVYIYNLALSVSNNTRIALLAATLWAIYPTQIIYESRLLFDSLIAATMPVMLYYVVEAVKSKRTGYFALAGLILGLTTITRPTVLILLPVILYFLFKAEKLKTMLFLFAALLPIIPVTISNWHNGDFVLISSQGGINFYIGNNAQSDGKSAVMPGFGQAWKYNDCVKYAESTTNRKLNPSEVSNFYFSKGFAYWKDNPSSAILLLGEKILVLIGYKEFGNNGDPYFLNNGSFLKYFLWFWSVIFALAIVGIIFSKFGYKPMLFAILIGNIVVILTFFVCDRFRLPIVPILIIFAAFGIDSLITDLFNKRFTGLFIFDIAILSSIVAGIIQKTDNSNEYFTLGNIYLRNNNNSKAIEYYLKSSEIDSLYPSVYLNMGIAFYRMGNADSAQYYFEKERSDRCHALSNIGVMKRTSGKFDEAITYGNMALSICNSDPEISYNLARSYFDEGDYIGAERILLSADSTDYRIVFLKGNINFVRNDYFNAEKCFNSVANFNEKGFLERYDVNSEIGDRGRESSTVEIFKAKSLFYIAQIQFANKRLSDAEYYLNKSIGLYSELPQAYALLGSVKLAKNATEDAEINLIKAKRLGYAGADLYFNLAAIYARKSDFATAKLFLLKALEIDPNLEIAQKSLEGIENILKK
jgi:tetratricopeptide (TPR) repeat protein